MSTQSETQNHSLKPIETTSFVQNKLDKITTSIVPYSNTESSDSDGECTQSRLLYNRFDEMTLPQNDVASCSNTAIDHTVSKRKGRSRKKKPEPEKWMRNQAKILRNHGKSYLSNSKTNKQEKPERQIKNACTDKCKLKCSTKVTNI